MTTQEKIAVMKALVEGKEIEHASLLDLSNWKPVAFPVWDWSHFDYRIKPEHPKPKYRPFKDVDEAFQATKERGDQLKRKDGITSRECPKYMALINFNDYDGLINGIGIKSLFDYYTFFDGAPFGVEEGGEE